MSTFLGTKLTNLDMNEVKLELKKRKKSYDDYDLYVYYKNLLCIEKKKSERKRKKFVQEGREEDAEFEPCNYISSIYRPKKVTKKGLYDYIDDNDNIYEDIVTNELYEDKNNYTDDIRFTFFNESISYSLLRNNDYIDGIPIGINIKMKHNDKREKTYHVSGIRGTSSPGSSHSQPSSPLLPILPQVCPSEKGDHLEENKNDGNKKNKQNADIQDARRDIGPKLPDVFELVRKSIISEGQNYQRVENDYVHMLSHRNHMISVKTKEQKEFKRLINETYRAKNNFEGAFFEKNENRFDQIRKREMSHLRRDFSNRVRDRTDELGKVGGRRIFGNILEENYSDSSYESVHGNVGHEKFFWEVKGNNAQIRNGDTADIFSGNACSDGGKLVSGCLGLFSPCNPSLLHEAEAGTFSEFYCRFFEDGNTTDDKQTNATCPLKDLYLRYSKLLNRHCEDKLSKTELLNLYAPQKNWVQTSNNGNEEENTKNAQNEMYALKNRITFNNDLKKKERFFFFCKMKHNEIKIKNIFSKKEYDEFKELMDRIIVFYPHFYTSDIINDKLNTDVQIRDYQYAKCLYDKLDISHMCPDSTISGNAKPTVDVAFAEIPSFVFETIFYL
ncbi:conserved Plasmodium protein, unknown function [Plasmodium ovale wallikeri]|uniref:Uncharacterized protein n=2 Tax=Plasmodium ovale TaxID=36330 RepID=A0A1A8ZA16_PLAOA|nr:conserved Plasmodium protein, unknown function [Plasmodium ovale wallikeri]SBT41021.1 conserved Plasmodium protein, unknown function [Plasmodium ovale wallikeri]SBT78070.1 conserved Plasmodium protein, unknown function [Plasmodium ovale]